MLFLGLILMAFLGSGWSAIEKMDYSRMPPLYKLDDYDRCLSNGSEKKAGIYCVVRSVIKPNIDSDIWYFNQNYTRNMNDKINYNILDRGVCLESCLNSLAGLSSERKAALYQEEPNYKFQSTLSSKYFPKTLAYRGSFEVLINQCTNLELERYNLTAFSEIEYCDSTMDSNRFDALDIFFIIVVILLIIAISLSTMYDVWLKKTPGISHFNASVPDKRTMTYLSFSIPRNCYNLFSEKNSELTRDLRFIHLVRIILVITVVFRHVFIINNTVPVSNPEKLEENFDTLTTAVTDCIRFFFVLSTFLLTTLFLDEAKNNAKNFATIEYIRKGIVERYIRLTPIYAFIILFRATFMIKLGDGPVWHKFMQVTHTNCRSNWWTNLLFINNYVQASEACALEGWYLGADFHLFILGLLLRIIIWKYPNRIKYILGAGLFISYGIIAVVSYIRELEGLILMPLSSHKSSLLLDKNFLEAYTTSHMQLGNVFIGAAGAVIYYKFRERIFVVGTKFKYFWYLNFLVMLANAIATKFLNVYYFGKPSWQTVICVSFMRHVWAWTFCFILIGLALRVNNMVSQFSDSIVLRPLSKLTYCVYLTHYTIMPILNYRLREVQILTSMSMYYSTFFNLVLSFVVSFILCISIELPFAAVYKYFEWKKGILKRE